MRVWEALHSWTPGQLHQMFPPDKEEGLLAKDLILDLLRGKDEVTLVDATPLIALEVKNETEISLEKFCAEMPVRMPYPFMWIELRSNYAVFLQDIPGGLKMLPFGLAKGRAWPLELCVEVPLNEHGCMDIEENLKFGWVYGFGTSTQKERHESLEYMKTLMGTTFYALAMFHCKNIGLQLEPDPWENMPPKLRQKRLKKGSLPPDRFHTLTLKRKGGDIPIQRILESHDTGGKLVGLHAVRGHFRTYTKDKPLCGRAVGTFWVPSFIRGDEALGYVNKNYKLDPSLSR